MLRQTFVAWLDRRTVRPLAERAKRSFGRGPTSSSSQRGAASGVGAASPALYHSGDVDDIDDVESLDRMDDFAAELAPRRPSSSSHRRDVPAPSVRTRETHSPQRYYSSGAASAGSGERHDAPRRDVRPPLPARRVITLARRPHASSGEAVRSHPSHSHSSVPSPSSRPQHEEEEADHLYEDTEDEAAAGAEIRTEKDAEYEADEATPDRGEISDAVSAAATAAAATPSSEKSSDAYRFLLNHIDAEIAALQRRHASVTTRRQAVQTKQTQRIKELFEVLEQPWTLLPTEVQPALPATGVDVYIKEQQLARQQNPGSAASDGQDKMFILALHKNYKSMPAGRKRFYEEAAHYNATLREEMKFQLTRGCARFESFLDTVQECSMEMAREGRIPELPSSHTQQRFQSARAGGSYFRAGAPPRPAWTGAAPPTKGTHLSQRPQHDAASSGDHQTQDGSPANDGGDAEGEKATHNGTRGLVRRGLAKFSATKAVPKGIKSAAQRIKETAKKRRGSRSMATSSPPSSADADDTATPTPSSSAKTSTKNAVRHRSTKHSPNSTTKKKILKAPTSGKMTKQPAVAGTNDKRNRKTSSKAIGVSRSIPLPSLGTLTSRKGKASLSSIGAVAKTAKAKIAPKKTGKGKPSKKK